MGNFPIRQTSDHSEHARRRSLDALGYSDLGNRLNAGMAKEQPQDVAILCAIHFWLNLTHNSSDKRCSEPLQPVR